MAPPGYRLVPIAPAPAALQPREIPFEDDEPAPPGYELHERPRRGLVIAGSIVLGVPWMFSIMGAVAEDFKDKTGYLLVPGIGPWLMLAAGGAKDRVTCTNGGSSGFSSCVDSRSGERAILTLDGLMQTAGVIMYAGGYLAPKRVWVRQGVEVSVVPAQLGPSAYGIGAVGTF